MAKTRMNVADREAIRDAIIAHKFDDMIANMERREYVLADLVWKHLHSDSDRRWMAKAPAGALAETDCMGVNCAGRTHYLHFGEWKMVDRRPKRRTFDKFNRRTDMPSALPLTEEINDWAMTLKGTRDERGNLRQSVLTALAGFRCFEDAIEGWPEAADFIRARQVRSSAPVRAVVVRYSDLSAKLDLPPEEKQAA